MSVSDLYKKLQESNGRRQNKRKNAHVNTQVTKNSGQPDVDAEQVHSPSNATQAPDTDHDRTESTKPVQGQTKPADKNHTQTLEQKSSKTVNNPRRQQMLKVLRESEARHKQKVQRDASIGIGDLVTVLTGPHADTTAHVCDLDYINMVAMVERVGSGQRLWLNLSNLAPTD